MELIVDVANVMGSKPDGWWRDRAGAAERLLAMLPPLVGREVLLPSGADGDRARDGARDGGTGRAPERVVIERIVAVVEGQAKRASAPAGIDVVGAPAVGDDEIVAVADRLVGEGRRVLVVTADRGLRERVSDRAHVAGPAWLNEVIGR